MLRLPGVEGKALYTHSWLGLGLNSAFAATSDMIQRMDRAGASNPGGGGSVKALHPGGGGGVKTLNPCVPRGYTTVKGDEGAGDFYKCLDVARLLIVGRHCPHKRCSLEGEYMPQLTGM